jgi:serine/threonine protein kinase
MITSSLGNGVLLNTYAALSTNFDRVCLLSCPVRPWQMPPEMRMNVIYNGAPVDVWSLGIAAFSLLAGFYPFAPQVFGGATDPCFEAVRKDSSASMRKGFCDVVFEYHGAPLNFTNDVKFLLNSMLSLDPSLRPSMTDIVKASFPLSPMPRLFSNMTVYHTSSHHAPAFRNTKKLPSKGEVDDDPTTFGAGDPEFKPPATATPISSRMAGIKPTSTSISTRAKLGLFVGAAVLGAVIILRSRSKA